MKGTIKTLTPRGFGFISREGETKDLFFHSKELKGVTFDELKVGDVVSFEVANGEKSTAQSTCREPKLRQVSKNRSAVKSGTVFCLAYFCF